MPSKRTVRPQDARKSKGSRVISSHLQSSPKVDVKPNVSETNINPHQPSSTLVQPFRFLDLPPELRIKIYNLVFDRRILHIKRCKKGGGLTYILLKEENHNEGRSSCRSTKRSAGLNNRNTAAQQAPLHREVAILNIIDSGWNPSKTISPDLLRPGQKLRRVPREVSAHGVQQTQQVQIQHDAHVRQIGHTQRPLHVAPHQSQTRNQRGQHQNLPSSSSSSHVKHHTRVQTLLIRPHPPRPGPVGALQTPTYAATPTTLATPTITSNSKHFQSHAHNFRSSLGAALLLTNRQLRAETTLPFYSPATFYFHSSNTLRTFLSSLSPLAQANILSLWLAHATSGEPGLAEHRPWKFRYDSRWEQVCLQAASSLVNLSDLRIVLKVCDWPLKVGIKESWVRPLLLFGQCTALDDVSVRIRMPSMWGEDDDTKKKRVREQLELAVERYLTRENRK